jgi:CheY-like chemotaxis protein/REP element-mobilizing transposase RayT
MSKLILAVSPDEKLLTQLSAHLQEGGRYQVYCVTSGKEAVARAAKDPFDLVILDSDTNDLPFPPLTRELIALLPGMKLLVYPPNNNPRHPLLNGVIANGYLNKPFFGPEVNEKISQVLRPPAAAHDQPSAENDITRLWVEYPESGQKLVEQLLGSTNASAGILLIHRQVASAAGALGDNTSQNIINFLSRYWTNIQTGELFRYLKMDGETRTYLVYATPLMHDVAFALIYHNNQSLIEIRSEVAHIRKAFMNRFANTRELRMEFPSFPARNAPPEITPLADIAVPSIDEKNPFLQQEQIDEQEAEYSGALPEAALTAAPAEEPAQSQIDETPEFTPADLEIPAAEEEIQPLEEVPQEPSLESQIPTAEEEVQPVTEEVQPDKETDRELSPEAQFSIAEEEAQPVAEEVQSVEETPQEPSFENILAEEIAHQPADEGPVSEPAAEELTSEPVLQESEENPLDEESFAALEGNGPLDEAPADESILEPAAEEQLPEFGPEITSDDLADFTPLNVEETVEEEIEGPVDESQPALTEAQLQQLDELLADMPSPDPEQPQPIAEAVETRSLDDFLSNLPTDSAPIEETETPAQEIQTESASSDWQPLSQNEIQSESISEPPAEEPAATVPPASEETVPMPVETPAAPASEEPVEPAAEEPVEPAAEEPYPDFDFKLPWEEEAPQPPAAVADVLSATIPAGTGEPEEQPVISDLSDFFFEYQILLIPANPQQLISHDIAALIKQKLPQLHETNGWKCTRITARPLYLQWSAVLPLDVCVSEMIQEIKDRANILIFARFPELLKDNLEGNFWAPGYFAVSGPQMLSNRMIEDYITLSRQILPEQFPQ